MSEVNIKITGSLRGYVLREPEAKPKNSPVRTGRSAKERATAVKGSGNEPGRTAHR